MLHPLIYFDFLLALTLIILYLDTFCGNVDIFIASFHTTNRPTWFD